MSRHISQNFLSKLKARTTILGTLVRRALWRIRHLEF